MAMTREEAEEFRQDCLYTQQQERDEDFKMRDDYDYFIAKVVPKDMAKELQQLYKACEEYDYDFDELIGDLR